MNSVTVQLEKYFQNGMRYDGRKFLEFRPVTVEYGVAPSAEGSAKVTIGDTVVIAGVKLAFEKPYPDTPNKGNLMVNAELSPIASPEFEAGPPSDFANELARVVDRSIRESKMIEVEKLCVTPGEKVWSVAIDIVSMNDGGNLFDASALAAVAALKDTRLPVVNADGKVEYGSKTDARLPLDPEPVLVTVSRINGKVLVDTSFEEEPAIDARLSVASLADGSLCAMQKGGPGALTPEELAEMIDIAVEHAGNLRSKL